MHATTFAAARDEDAVRTQALFCKGKGDPGTRVNISGNFSVKLSVTTNEHVGRACIRPCQENNIIWR